MTDTGFVGAVGEEAGFVDISFNVIGYGDVQGSLLDISVEDLDGLFRALDSCR